MNRTLRVAARAALAAALAAAFAGCAKIEPINAPAPTGGSADYSVYVSLGTSISAGWQSGGLVDRHQTRSFPYLFARQAGVTRFDQPLVGGDGLPALSRLVSLGPPLTITSQGRTNGSPTNFALATPYHHFAVPFSILPDVTDPSQYYTPPYTGRDLMFDTIERRRGALLAQIVAGMNPPPTFFTLEFGSNELLGPATRGSGTPTIPAATWGVILHNILDAMEGSFPDAKFAIFTVPDVTRIPFVRTLPPLVLDRDGLPASPTTLLLGPGSGPGGTMVPGQDFVLLTAGPLLAAGVGYPLGSTSYSSGFGVPGTGVALDDTLVLSAPEAASIRAAVDGYNAAIRTEAAARGFALVDLHALLRQAASPGFVIGGSTYTGAFLTGGLFSLDGVHPTDLAHAILCNALIEAVNATYGSRLPLVNVAEVASVRADAAVPARYEGVLSPVRNDAVADLAGLFPWREPARP